MFRQGVLLSSLAVSGTAGFSTPTARTALEHVSVMQETIEHGGDSSAVTEQFVKPSLPRGRALHTTSALSRPHKVKVFEFSADLSHESEGSGGQIEREPTACSLDWAAWLYDLLKPQVSQVVVCSPRKNALLKDASKSDRIDTHKLAELPHVRLQHHRIRAPLLISFETEGAQLFANAKSAEDEIEDVVACCSARQGVEGVKSLIKIKKNHLVGHVCYRGLLGSIEGCQCL